MPRILSIQAPSVEAVQIKQFAQGLGGCWRVGAAHCPALWPAALDVTPAKDRPLRSRHGGGELALARTRRRANRTSFPKRGVQGLAAVKRESSRPLLSAVRSTQPVTEVMRLETVVATTAPLPPLNAARAPAEPLNLTLSQQALADSVAKTGFARARPQPDASGRQWQAFAQKFGPNDEITEERLADGGVQVRSKHGCYRIVPSATQRLDPYNWSPSYVIQSNQDTSKWCSDGNGFVAGTREGKGTPLGGRALHRVSDCRS